ncbi:SH3 domain-containing protein 21 isoform X1 [Syngnathus scovelli]|uniref:SH3 domain-containing protein 21 isoform X1 n=1 Tax=Syngnathus scovelli TaxID=161590 RepID=UPI00211017BA|nr:SH3 domain-containing protein 21 isoform X1 [Syngnathus scovelli]
MEVLVLINFEGTMGDEISVRMGDVVKNVTKASEEGWLEGEVRGKRGIFPANFVKEVPVYLMGDSKREPRSIRTTKRRKQVRTCEVVFAYSPLNDDELQLVVGETLEIISEIEDGWWMGIKNGRVGAFPCNFVREILVAPKGESSNYFSSRAGQRPSWNHGKHNDSKARPKLSDAVFSKEISQRATIRSKAKTVVECCQVMFNYKAKAEDELDLKIGDVVVILRKETEDDGWWEGELNGRCGFFPDNFVMVIPPMDSLKAGNNSLPPARNIKKEVPEKTESPAMDKSAPTKTKDEKPELKDLRSNPPTKVKLPSINKLSPTQLKDKANKGLSKANGAESQHSPKSPEDKNGDHFDAADPDGDKLNHPTANRAKPPQRRPPTGAATGVQTANDSGPELTKKVPSDKLPGLQKGSEHLKPPPAKVDFRPKSPPPLRPAAPRLPAEVQSVAQKDEVTLASLWTEVKDLRMALELLQTRHEHDMKEVKEELQDERNKRLTLQEEVHTLRKKK